MVVQGQLGMAPLARVARRIGLHREIIGADRGNPAIGDPVQQPVVPPVEPRAGGRQNLGVRVLLHRQHQFGKAGMEAEEIARLHRDIHPLHRPHQPVIADKSPRPTVQPFQIDQHAAALCAGGGEVFDPQTMRALGLARVLGADQVGAGAEAVVIDDLLRAIAIRVEQRADMAERVPMGRVLCVKRHRLVRDHVAGAGRQPRQRAVEVIAVAALGIMEPRFAAMGEQLVAARIVERQRQAEALAGADLPRGAPSRLGGQKVHAPAFVIRAELPPVGAVGSDFPALFRHVDAPLDGGPAVAQPMALPWSGSRKFRARAGFGLPIASGGCVRRGETAGRCATAGGRRGRRRR